MRIVIMGAGAIGSLYGGLLSFVDGVDVILVGRAPHISQIKAMGLKISGVMGNHVAFPKATDDPLEIPNADIVFITTKSYDTLEATRQIRHLVEGGAHVLVLQNGLGTEKLVENELGVTRILRATTCMGAKLVEPGHVDVTGVGITEVGSHYDDNLETVETIVDLLEAAGFNVRSSDNMDGVVWTKTLVNCGINPVGALTGLTNGEIYRNKSLRGLIINLVNETMLVVRALGIRLTTDDPIRYTLGTAKATANNLNSMLQDILARKRTEIDYLTGAVIKIARRLGISLPVSETIYTLVKALEFRLVSDPVPSMEFVSTEELVRILVES